MGTFNTKAMQKPRKNGNDNQDVLYVVGELLKEFQALVPKEACEKSV